MQKGVVYKVQNLDNGKVYVGCTANFGKRVNAHLGSAFLGRNSCLFYPELKQNPEKFSFQIVERDIPISELKIRESKWIKFYGSAVTGYNQCIYSGNECLTESQVAEIKMMLSSDKVKFLDIAKAFNVDDTTISDINRGKAWHSSDDSYPLRKSTVKRKKLSLETLTLIHDLLNDSTVSFKEIASRFGWQSEAVVRKINAGTYSIRLYDPEKYPIRSVDSRKGSRS